MKCEDVRDLLAPYFDGELAVPEARAVERHLPACPRCAETIAQWTATRAALRGMETPRLRADFAARLGGALAEAARPPRQRLAPRALAAGVALLVGGGLLGALATWAVLGRGVPEERVAHDVVAAHVRSLLGTSPVEVASSDNHTVKPWFAGHLSFAPPVERFVREGFELVGGRLDYIDGKEAAAIVLKRRRHIINLLIWPEAGPDAPARQQQARGFTLMNWRSGGLAFWAVSDMEPDEMKLLADAAPQIR